MITNSDAIQTLTAMKNMAEFFRKTHVGGTIVYGMEIERKCLIDEINALHLAITTLSNQTEVVRCKDCKFVDKEFCLTSFYMSGICEYKTYYGMDYCSYGERRAG